MRLVKLYEVMDIVLDYVPDDDGSVAKTNLQEMADEIENLDSYEMSEDDIDDYKMDENDIDDYEW